MSTTPVHITSDTTEYGERSVRDSVHHNRMDPPRTEKSRSRVISGRGKALTNRSALRWLQRHHHGEYRGSQFQMSRVTIRLSFDMPSVPFVLTVIVCVAPTPLLGLSAMALHIVVMTLRNVFSTIRIRSLTYSVSIVSFVDRLSTVLRYAVGLTSGEPRHRLL